jgi:hypothetical protein
VVSTGWIKRKLRDVIELISLGWFYEEALTAAGDL